MFNKILNWVVVSVLLFLGFCFLVPSTHVLCAFVGSILFTLLISKFIAEVKNKQKLSSINKGLSWFGDFLLLLIGTSFIFPYTPTGLIQMFALFISVLIIVVRAVFRS